MQKFFVSPRRSPLYLFYLYMPHLRLLGRYWDISYDDFGWWSMGALATRLLEIGFAISLLVNLISLVKLNTQQQEDYDVVSCYQVPLYILISTLVFILYQVVIESLILHENLTGPFNNMKAQKRVPFLLLFHLPSSILEIGFIVFLSKYALPFVSLDSCNYLIHYNVHLIVYSLLFLFIWNFSFFVVLVLTSFNCNQSRDKEKYWSGLTKSVLGWFTRNHFWKEPEMFEMIGKIIITVLHEKDFTFSDAISGILLMRVLHKNREDEMVQLESIKNHTNVSLKSSKEEKNFLNKVKLRKESTYHFQRAEDSVLFNTASDFELLEECSYYVQYAIAMYGWLNTAVYGCCWCRCKKRHPRVEGDYCCSLHLQSVLQSTNLNDEEVIYANFREAVWLQPYSIIKDSLKKEIVLTFRGTFSPQDFITDGLAVNVRLEDAGAQYNFPAIGQVAHKGIWDCANGIMNDLERHNYLNAILLGENPNAGYELPESVKNCSVKDGYELVIVGHSLGGAIAALVSLMLRQKHPNVRVFAYSPLPCTTPGLAEYLSSYVTSVNLGKDCVPRLSVLTLSRLRDDMVNATRKCKVSKLTLTIRFFLGYKLGLEDLFDVTDTSHIAEGLDSKTNSDEKSSPKLTPLLKFGLDVSHLVPRGLSEEEFPKMYPPGNLIHLSKLHSSYTCCCVIPLFCRNDDYDARWTNGDFFQEIVLSPLMGEDHIPHKTAQVMKKILMDRKKKSIPSHESQV